MHIVIMSKSCVPVTFESGYALDGIMSKACNCLKAYLGDLVSLYKRLSEIFHVLLQRNAKSDMVIESWAVFSDENTADFLIVAKDSSSLHLSSIN